jgi:hypothetical protein
VYLVESPFSVMHFHQLGLSAVASMGWMVSPQQVVILRTLARGVAFLPDSGNHKEAKAYAGILASNLWVRMPAMPADDPEHLSLDQIQAVTQTPRRSGFFIYQS